MAFGRKIKTSKNPISSVTDIQTELTRPKSCSKYMSSCIIIFSLINTEILGCVSYLYVSQHSKSTVFYKANLSPFFLLTSCRRDAC